MCKSVEVDVSWIKDGLGEYKPGEWRIGNMIPAGYPAYLRVMHPVQRLYEEHVEEVSWREVAAASGLQVTALSVFEDLLPLDDIDVGLPSGDYLGDALCGRLAEILAIHTRFPRACTFLFGVYWGEYFPEGTAMPNVELDGTRFSVATGSCRDACGFSVYPSMWWPTDRNWIVSTPADSQSTLVGCGRDAAQELLADPVIEAWPISRDALAPRQL
jgi:hypothetical protein